MTASSAALASAILQSGREQEQEHQHEYDQTLALLTSSLTLPSSDVLAAHLQHAHSQAQHALQLQTHSRAALLDHLQSSSALDQQLSAKLSSLPEQIDATEEAILALSSSDTQNQIHSTLEHNLKALTQLQHARDYFALLAAAEDLRIEALALQQQQQQDDIRPQLKRLASLHSLCTQSEAVLSRASPQALLFIKAQRDYTFQQIRRKAISALRDALSNAGWSPSATTTLQEQQQSPARLDSHRSIQIAWKNLCHFQRITAKLDLSPKPTIPYLRPESDEYASSTSSASLPRPGSDSYVPILPITVLLDVLLLLRFRYQFDSSRPSNRLDKPEWYLNYILGLLRTYTTNPSEDLFQPMRGSIARLCALAGWGYAQGVVPTASDNSKTQQQNKLLLDTGAELLHGLLVPLRSKLNSSIPLLLSQPPLLAHTITQYILFDQSLQSTYPPAALHTQSRGVALSLADTVLNHTEWFAAWLEGERAHAEERLDEILNAPDAWVIGSADGVEDEDDVVLSGPGSGRDGDESSAGGGGVGPVQKFPVQPLAESSAQPAAAASSSNNKAASSSSGKTVRSAQQIVELLESIQERAAPLPMLAHRLAFLARIQLPLLRAYADRLTRSLDAFESLSGAFARAMPGGGLDIVGGHVVGSAVKGAAAGVVSAAAAAGGTAVSHTTGIGGGAGSNELDMVRGLRGLGRLLKAHLGASHIVDTLTAWNENTPYFLALSAELRSTEEGKKLAVDLRMSEVVAEEEALDKASLVGLLRRSLRRQQQVAKESAGSAGSRNRSASRARSDDKRSHGLGARSETSEGAENDGEREAGVWDDILAKYQTLLRRASVAMERLVVHEIVDALKPYSYRRWDDGRSETAAVAPSAADADDDDEEEDDPWGQDEPHAKKHVSATAPVAPIEPTPTPTLLPALTLLSTHLGHLLPALPSKHALPLYRSIAVSLSTSVVDRVVMSGGAYRYTLQGGQRFAADVENGWFGVLSELLLNFGQRRGGGGGSATNAAAAGLEAMGRRPRAVWRELEGVARLLTLPSETSPANSASPSEGLGNWTLEKATYTLFEGAEGEGGWELLRKELRLDGVTWNRARETIRRRVECTR
ncbi:hypothetical protein OC846_002259 [Tilletia horrida]|uniref:Uncharacterized protein n=1 Tax=Tilletia horrida TaxID=155126 RepID=A0AAN6GUG7_9BASI|nr:hypothetical protein OC846_002259 [Tilletia horrida]KAK0568020.1 hypothetical protein OC861_002335 [Tilletia horrida]